MSPEGATSLFHDRPIRPLPKRRLRERLSPDVADSIEYPPAPQTTPALFSYPCNLRSGLYEEPEGSNSANGVAAPDVVGRQTSRRHGLGPESDSDDAAAKRTVVTRPPPEALGRSVRLAQSSELPSGHQTPPSATSSADGYDSLENTNNKKKRKIPTAGESGGGHGLNDAHSVPGGLATPLPPGDRSGEAGGATSAAYYGSGSFASTGQSVSGAGRGRFGRSRSGRSPLGALSDATNNWTGRNSKVRPVPWSSPQPEKMPPSPGQENISLLHQPQPAKPSPAATKFTFTCGSQVPGSLAWPGSDPKLPDMPGQSQGAAASGNYAKSRATQTPAPPGAYPGSSQDTPASDISMKVEAPLSSSSEKKARRRADRDLQIAARKRKQETARQNQINPPKPEDEWVCEFCEYEKIFGYPPAALIRQYEIKDRKLRQHEEERRRVWEKAKARSRKAKKGGKSPAKNSNPPATHPGDAQQAPHMNSNQSQGTQSEEYYEDDYEESIGYDVDEQLPPLVPDSAATRQVEHQIVDNSYDGGTGAGGSGKNPGGGHLDI